MTFEDSPSYEDYAAIAPIQVRQRPVPVMTMYFKGGAEAATPIIDWVLLNGGTATWTEAYPEDTVTMSYPDGTKQDVLVTGDTEHIKVRTPEGTLKAAPGSWIIQDVTGEFSVCEPETFKLSHDFI